MVRVAWPLLSCIVAMTVSCAREAPADFIVHNARIYTADDARPRAEAIAIRGDRIAALGTSVEMLRLAGDRTTIVDAAGAAVLPGLHDAHGHFTGLGASLEMLALRGTGGWEQIVGLVRQRAASMRPGEWILGRGWDQNDWAVTDFPTHDLISAAAPDNPVYLTRVDGHAAIANRAAMAAAGLTGSSTDPDGGRIIRDGNGNPTGMLVDTAMSLVSARIPPVSEAQLDEQILRADAEARRLGLTMVHDAGTNTATVDAYKRLIDAGRLQTRLYVMLRGPLAMLEPHFARGPITGYANHHLAVRAIKIAADGALGSRGAALLEPYSDDPGNRGLLVTPPETVYAQTLAASRAGFQTSIHAIGDRANRLVMDTFERVQKEVPGSRELRMRNEHAQILDVMEIPRFARLNVIASMQATHATADLPWAPARLGPQRIAEGAYVWQTLLANGVVLANGSDFPVEEPNPMFGFYAAITRQDRSGQPPGGWQPEQRLSREEALKSFTIHAAFAAHAERELGSLTPGKLADLVVLSNDVMTSAPAEILSTTVTLTVIGGKVVHDAGSAASRRP